jgi:hypothetical protein
VIAWFHNHTRTLARTRGTSSNQGVLNFKLKPKILQGWQAYHALTYETQWKTEVDKTWAEYKTKWESEHPDEKPAKTRFEVMNDFIKEKFAQASPEVLKEVEEFRKTLREETADQTDNIAFQK